MSVIKEFKEFAVRGNVIDMAIGVIIGGAFGKIVSSLVDDVLMPPLGLLTSGIDFSAQKIILQKQVLDAAGAVTQAEVAVRYGVFIQTSISFFLVAVVVFFVVKAMNKFRADEAAAATPPPAPEPSTQEKLLMEIRDALKNNKA